MDQEDLFIEPDFSCNKSLYSLREDSLLQIFKLMYKFFTPFISNGKLMIDCQDLFGGSALEPYCLRHGCAAVSIYCSCKLEQALLNETIKYDKHTL